MSERWRERERDTHRQTDRQIDRQTDRQTDTHTHTYTHTHAPLPGFAALQVAPVCLALIGAVCMYCMLLLVRVKDALCAKHKLAAITFGEAVSRLTCQPF